MKTVADFRSWMRNAVRSRFPHGMHVSGYGRVTAGGVSLDYVLPVDFPAGYMDCIRNRAGAVDTPIMRAWLQTREPQLFEADNPWPATPGAWFACFQRHDLRNVAAHGDVDDASCVATYHCFCRIPGKLGPQHAAALRAMLPELHHAMRQVIGGLSGGPDPSALLRVLSPREQDIAEAVRQGLANGQIAARWQLSENTVKHHLTSVFDKLNVRTRSELMHRLGPTTPASGGLRIL